MKLVYCMDCGGTMALHRAHTMDAVKNNFMCATYKKKSNDKCFGHYIMDSTTVPKPQEVALKAIGRQCIRTVCRYTPPISRYIKVFMG